MTKKNSTQERLIFGGVALVFLGLLQGLMIPFSFNPHMALSAHVTAVTSGTLLAVFGIIWHRIALGPKPQNIAFWGTVFGFYAVWLSLVLAAVTGASRRFPIAGKGFEAARVAEDAVTILATLGVVAQLIGVGIIFFGLARGLRAD